MRCWSCLVKTMQLSVWKLPERDFWPFLRSHSITMPLFSLAKSMTRNSTENVHFSMAEWENLTYFRSRVLTSFILCLLFRWKSMKKHWHCWPTNWRTSSRLKSTVSCIHRYVISCWLQGKTIVCSHRLGPEPVVQAELVPATSRCVFAAQRQEPWHLDSSGFVSSQLTWSSLQCSTGELSHFDAALVFLCRCRS